MQSSENDGSNQKKKPLTIPPTSRNPQKMSVLKGEHDKNHQQ